jgi:hypothetical protein
LQEKTNSQRPKLYANTVLSLLESGLHSAVIGPESELPRICFLGFQDLIPRHNKMCRSDDSEIDC